MDTIVSTIKDGIAHHEGEARKLRNALSALTETAKPKRTRSRKTTSSGQKSGGTQNRRTRTRNRKSRKRG
jgi:hypothetical protein